MSQHFQRLPKQLQQAVVGNVCLIGDSKYVHSMNIVIRRNIIYMNHTPSLVITVYTWEKKETYLATLMVALSIHISSSSSSSLQNTGLIKGHCFNRTSKLNYSCWTQVNTEMRLAELIKTLPHYIRRCQPRSDWLLK